LEALGANPWCLLANPRAYEAVAALCAVIPEGVAKKLRTHVETSEEPCSFCKMSWWESQSVR